MSKISLASNASGTGIFTLASPATNTNRTLTLPDSTGTLLDTNGGTITGTLTVTGVTTLGNGAIFNTPASGVATNLTGLPLTTGVTGTLPVANGGTGLTSGTSGGVLAYTAAGTLASSTALAASALVIGGGAGAAPSTTTTGTGVVTALGVNTGTAGAFVVNGGALGTPSSGTATNLTGLPISTGVSGLGTGVATFLATPSSANLAAAVTDETGSGALVFATSPTLVTPALGTPSSGTVTNLTGTASININGTVGATTATTGAFTTLTASSTLTVTGAGSIEGLTVGKGAGAVATNTAFGASALAANTTAVENAAFGYFALRDNTAVTNTAFGAYAAYQNTSGAGVSAFGNGSMQSNTTGAENSGFGKLSLSINTTGSYNTAIGRSALQSNTTASYNTAVGYQALYASTPPVVTAGAFVVSTSYTIVTVGTTNFVAIGASANTVGVVFTATGAGSGTGTASTNVSAVNTAIGYGAGSAITTGTKNTIIGAYNGNQGSLDIRTASNYVVLSDGDGNPRAYWNGAAATFNGGLAVTGTLTASTAIGTASGGTGVGGATPFTANGVVYASSSSALATGAALTFDTNIFTAKGVNAGFSLALDATTTPLIFKSNDLTGATWAPIAFSLGNGTGSYIEQMRLTSTGLTVKDVGTFGRQDYTYQNTQKVLVLNADPVSGTYTPSQFRFYTYPGESNLTALKLGIRAYSVAGGETTDLLNINATGAVALKDATNAATGTGITFPATQSASSNANTLDDYEEGTWPAILTGVTTAPTTPITATGSYTKIGNCVTVSVIFTNKDTTGAVGQIIVTGLPFAGIIGVNQIGSAASYGLSIPNKTLNSWITGGTTTLEIISSADNGAWSFPDITAGASKYLYITATFLV